MALESGAAAPGPEASKPSLVLGDMDVEDEVDEAPPNQNEFAVTMEEEENRAQENLQPETSGTSGASTVQNNGDPAALPKPSTSSMQSAPATGQTSGSVKKPTSAIEEIMNRDKYDGEAWQNLFMEAQNKPIEEAREIYERFFEVFPTAGKYWKLYIEHEIKERNYERVELLFHRCLLRCPNIDLWKTYASYVRTIKTDDSPSGRADIARAYEFALEHVGMDINSTQLWTDYIAFVKSQPTATKFEEGQQITAVRKLYQRAIENPMLNLDQIWKDYEAWENNLNKILAKQLIQDHSQRYNAARAVLRERKSYMEGIATHMLARPPRASQKDDHQAMLWKRLILFEKGNPQKLDPPALKLRVLFTYNQALLYLYHYQDVWLDAASWLYEVGGGSAGAIEEAIAMYERALQALPNALLIYFGYAEFLEGIKKTKEAVDIYERLLAHEVHKDNALVHIQYMRFARRAEGIDAARKVFMRARKLPGCSYQVYVASAMMEYRINKDAKVARNIFELGMKTFGTMVPYLLHYIRFLWELNEEHNLRVLFERLLTLSLPSEKVREIWGLFVEFECEFGADLAALLKVEKRRATALPDIDADAVLSLVHRNRYLDLWPCSTAELSSFRQSSPSANPVAAATGGGTASAKKEGKARAGESEAGVTAQSSAAASYASRFPRPDVSQLVPYKPEMGAALPPGAAGASVYSSPQFPTLYATLPEPVLRLLMWLPPPEMYHGPQLDIEKVLAMLRDMTLASPSGPIGAPEGHATATLPVVAAATAPRAAQKRKAPEDGFDEEDSTTHARPPPPGYDVFRERKAEKARKYTTDY